MAGVFLWLIPFLGAGRSPTVTVFLAAGAGAAAAGAVGEALEWAPSRWRVPGVVKVATVVVVALAVLAAGGGQKFTYGDVGALSLTLTSATTTIDPAANERLEGDVSLKNTGTATARVYPYFWMWVVDPSGHALHTYHQGCPIAGASLRSEADLVEIPPGAALSWHFDVPTARADTSNSSIGRPSIACGALLFEAHGTHQIGASFSSTSFGSFPNLPVWAGERHSEAAPLAVA